ncbi:hypothetical protein INS49_004538 [Diaporthe citri]|uniref:uncharacterized protein n=1 Tax=Diaporthe citri TaxID=83186 RepID=UPI001C7FF716|nr:uncharacterized protein INS49_004538 [Diaporthe citri]KAG6354521.1 hypothetical protein INS49_004538 [Diaporthe citri]
MVVHPTGPESPDLTIHDSLAIVEFLAETHPELNLWPEDKQLRALARSAVAKMHSGFTALRNEFATNFIARYEFAGRVPMSEQAKGDCERMVKLWGESRAATVERLKALGKEEGDEGFLFGKFGIADAFFWPVLWRFRTYNLPLTGISDQGLDWMETVWKNPKLKSIGKDYFAQTEDTATKVDHYDDIFSGNPSVKYGFFTEDWEFERPAGRKL